MASSFEELETVTESSTDDNDNVPNIELNEPGDEFVGDVRHIERNVGKYDKMLVHVTVDGEPRKYWCQAEVERKLERAGIGPGDTVGVRKSERSYTFENDDGEEIEAYEFDVGVSDGGDE
jgi:hypothetical protein